MFGKGGKLEKYGSKIRHTGRRKKRGQNPKLMLEYPYTYEGVNGNERYQQ